MTFYWSYKSIPELKRLPAPEAKRVWKECRAANRWRFLPVLSTMVFLSLLMFGVIPLFHGFWVIFPFAILMGAEGFVVEHFLNAAVLPEIRKRVGGLCINCGYDIRATTGRCPECGAATDGKTAVNDAAGQK